MNFTIVLCILLLTIALTAGCGSGGDCPVTKWNVVIAKVDQNGNYRWSEVFDSGIANRVTEIVPAPDGGVVIAGYQSTKRSYCSMNLKPRITMLSGEGKIVWDRFFDVPDIGKTFGMPSCIDIGKAVTIIASRDGGYVTVFNNGEVVKIDAGGKTIWDTNLNTFSDYWAVTEDNNGDIVVAGPSLTKLDAYGNMVWQRSYPESNKSEVNSISNLKSNDGFLMESLIRGAYVNHRILFSVFDEDGYFIKATQIPQDSNYYQRILVQRENGYRVYYYDEDLAVHNQTGLLVLDAYGNLIDRSAVNVTYPLVITNDNKSVFTKIVSPYVHVISTDTNQTVEWDCTLSEEMPVGLFTDRIIETTDGGFVIVYHQYGGTVDLST